jgi:hypothetical protein
LFVKKLDRISANDQKFFKKTKKFEEIKKIFIFTSKTPYKMPCFLGIGEEQKNPH